MRQKIIYLHFLIIGIIGSSCNPPIVDHNYTCTYHYINQSNQPIQMMIYNSYDESDKLIGDHKIAVDDSLSFTLSGDMVPLSPFFDFFRSKIGDSIYLSFANDQYQTYSKKWKDDIFERKKYRQVEITKYNIVHYWKFTKEDCKNAIVIEP